MSSVGVENCHLKVKVETAPMESEVQVHVEVAVPVVNSATVTVDVSEAEGATVSELMGCELPPPLDFSLKGKAVVTPFMSASILSELAVCSSVLSLPLNPSISVPLPDRVNHL